MFVFFCSRLAGDFFAFVDVLDGDFIFIVVVFVKVSDGKRCRAIVGPFDEGIAVRIAFGEPAEAVIKVL